MMNWWRLIALFLIVSLMVWVKSFHRVFTANQRLLRKKGLRLAVKNIEEGIFLSSGDATMQTEGLVKLNQGYNVLIPFANDSAALGPHSLSEGLVILQTQCIMKYAGINVTFDVSLGTEKLDHDFECEVYAIVYHALLSSLDSRNCSLITVHVNKLKKNILIEVLDNGVGKNSFNRMINFNLGDYVINQIAKSLNTICHRSGNRKGNKMSICLSAHLARGADRRKKQLSK